MPGTNFPKFPRKHTLVPLFDAKGAFGSAAGSLKVPPLAILVYNNRLERAISAGLGLRPRNDLSRYMGNPKGIKTGRRGRILVVRLGIGAPMTGVAAEELFALGVKDIVIMGTAGGIGTGLSIGDILLCTKAVRDEGTSHHYIKNSRYVAPSTTLTASLGAAMTRLGIKYRKGPTWTIDAPYMETAREVIHYRRLGVLSVEMEAAALFAVARKRRRRAAALFTVSDILDPSGWSGFTADGKRIRQRYSYPAMAGVVAALCG